MFFKFRTHFFNLGAATTKHKGVTSKTKPFSEKLPGAVLEPLNLPEIPPELSPVSAKTPDATPEPKDNHKANLVHEDHTSDVAEARKFSKYPQKVVKGNKTSSQTSTGLVNPQRSKNSSKGSLEMELLPKTHVVATSGSQNISKIAPKTDSRSKRLRKTSAGSGGSAETSLRSKAIPEVEQLPEKPSGAASDNKNKSWVQSTNQTKHEKSQKESLKPKSLPDAAANPEKSQGNVSLPTTFTRKVPKSNNLTKTAPKANNHLKASQRLQVFPRVYAGHKNNSVKGFIPKKPTGTAPRFKHSFSNHLKLTSGVENALKVSKEQKNSKNLDKGQMTSQNISVLPKAAKDVSFQVKKPSRNVTSRTKLPTQTSQEHQKPLNTATGFSNSSKETLFSKETAAKTSGFNNSSTSYTNRAPGIDSTSNTSSAAITELAIGPQNSSKIGSLQKTPNGTHAGTKKSTGAPSEIGPEAKSSLKISAKPKTSQKAPSRSTQSTRMDTKSLKKPEEPAKNSSRVVTSKNNDGSLSVTIEISNSTTKITDAKPKKQNPSKQM